MVARVIPVNVQVPDLATAPMIADFVEHALRVAYIARRDLAKLPEADWATPGIYVLLTGDGSGQVYVGQAVSLRSRLMQHRSAPKLDWVRAIVIKRDTSHGFNSAEIGYLEGRLSAELDAVESLSVVKGKSDQDATLPPHMLLSLDALLPSMVAAIRLGGIDTYKDADLPEESEINGQVRRGRRMHNTLPGSVPDLLAAGLLQAGAELHVKQGGRTAKGTVTTSGEIIVNGVAYNSPSRASATALGLQSSNGWDAWHVGKHTGPTLSSLRAQLAASEVADG